MREPIIRFLLLVAWLFLFAGMLDHSEGERNKGMVVFPGRIEHLVTGFSRTWQHSPTEQELGSLIEDYISKEFKVSKLSDFLQGANGH